MSFAFKKISPSDINITDYTANKNYKYLDTEISGSGINIFIGENSPISINNGFDPINDDKTTNNEYRRLVFDSIKHLFYHNYISSGTFYISSSYEEYPQTTLFSGSYTTNLRKINNIEGYSFQGNNSIYNESTRYDGTALYDEAYFDSNRGSLITVISLDKNIYGNKINPNTFLISDDVFYIKDDGEGNIFDYSTKSNYDNIIKSGIPSAIYVGNIFYSLGIIIITNSDYICILGSPPTAVNDYFSYENVSAGTDPQLDILSNDYSDCGGIDYSSLTLTSLPGKTFPDCYIGGDSLLHILRNQNSYIPGKYQIGYTIKNNTGLQSNVGLVNLDITSQPLRISNFNNTKTCKNSPGNIYVSFNIEYGTPTYSYSLDNITYTPISGFENISISQSITPTNFIYVKDYINKIASQSIDSYYPLLYVYPTMSNAPYCNPTSGSINIHASGGIYYTINGGISRSLDTTYYLSSGSYTASIYDSNNCFTTYSFSIQNTNPITYTLLTQSINCNGSSSGIINITDINGGSGNYILSLTSGSFNSTSSYNDELEKGIYSLSITDTNGCVLNDFINITSNNSIIFSTTSSYINEYNHVIEINATGGLSPYTYKIQTPNNLYISDNNIIILNYDTLDAMYITSSIIDSVGCISNNIYTEIYGRTYEYSGSYCENI